MPNGTVVETVDDPDLELIRSLSGHRRLNADQARTRYEAILAVLEKNPGRSHAWLARKIGCSASNVSRLVGTACAVLGVSGNRPI